MSTDADVMIIYVKNEQGVALPIYVRQKDIVDVIWCEVVACSAIHRRSISGKALYYKGRRLQRSELIGNIGIQHYDTVVLQQMHPQITKQISESLGQTADVVEPVERATKEV